MASFGDSENLVENLVDEREQESRTKLILNKLEHAFSSLGLTPFSSRIILQFISSKLRDGQGAKISKVVDYLLQLIKTQTERSPYPEDTKDRDGCPQIIPHLRAKPRWSIEDFPWISELQTAFPQIKQEFLDLRQKDIDSKGGFQKYYAATSSVSNDPLTSSSSASHCPTGSSSGTGDWNVCYLFLHGVDFSENTSKCPITTQTIKSIPKQYNHAFFSALAPDTHIDAHYGPTNKKLRCFLPLFVPPSPVDHPELSCCLRVNGEIIRLHEGECVVFDDSFLHDAMNPSLSSPRIVLILDVWHPDLTDEEIKILEFINKAQINAAKRMKKELQRQENNEESTDSTNIVPPSDDFLSLINNSKELGISELEIRKIWGEYV